MGGTRVPGVTLTLDAAGAVKTLRVVSPQQAIPIQFDDYTVMKSPLSDFRSAADAAGLPTYIRHLDRGETARFELPF